MSELKMNIPLPEDPPPEESSIHETSITDEPIRYSPSLAAEDDAEDFKEISEVSPHALPSSSINESIALPSAVLGKSAAKKRLLAFSLAKQNVKKFINDKKSMEPSTPTKNSAKEGDHRRSKKKSKKGVLDKARDVISEIEEIKRQENIQQQKENMQQSFPRWNKNNSRSCTGPISIPDLEEEDIYKIDSLVEKILAKEARKERSERDKEAEKKDRRDKRDKEKLVPNSWEEFTKAGFTAYHYRRFKFRREKFSRTSKERSSRSRSDGDETDIAGKKQYNLLETPMVLKLPLTVVGIDDDYKDFPSWCIKYTYTRPNISYSINPSKARSMLLSRREMMKTLTEDVKEIIDKFLEMKSEKSIQ
ncbi:hypothetical protein O3M35_013030 [Rhynocoris fuscipes]|uniref:Uncharacterized protein n=1 Tax=Rhynocoris fuscipes TaxID=488301 RepID=A0AAW1CFC1_9HEMI